MADNQNESSLKFFGSIGPAGSFVTLCEKICHRLFPAAYEQIDPIQGPAMQFE